MAHAPPRWYSVAAATADLSMRISPLEGDLDLNSAITLIAGESAFNAWDKRFLGEFILASKARLAQSFSLVTARNFAIALRFRATISERNSRFIFPDLSPG